MTIRDVTLVPLVTRLAELVVLQQLVPQQVKVAKKRLAVQTRATLEEVVKVQLAVNWQEHFAKSGSLTFSCDTAYTTNSFPRKIAVHLVKNERDINPRNKEERFNLVADVIEYFTALVNRNR